MAVVQKRKIRWVISLLLVMLYFSGLTAQAQYGGGNDTTELAETSTYVFLPDESTVVQTGGFIGVHETYPIKGQFRLTVDFDAGTALFSQVDANLVDERPFLPTESLGELFNMAELQGTVVNDALIEFRGKTADNTNTDIALTLTFTDAAVQLTGQTIPGGADFFIFNVDAVAQRKYGGGIGEPNSPYLIYIAEQMNEIGADANDWDKHFKLMADIDLSGYTGTDFNIIGYYVSWNSPDNKPFTGIFDGNGHTISNFSYTSTDRGGVGLFGHVVGKNAEIKYLGLIDPNIDAGTGDDVGSLVGNLSGSITSCYAEGGSVSGALFVGGLVGWNEGSITASYSTGTVSGTDWDVGGLAGGNDGSITASYSTGTVTGNGEVGGLVGWNYEGSITASYSTGTVTGNGCVGGLVGLCWGTISNSYANGSVSGTNNVGGLVGWNDNEWGNLGVTTTSFWDIETSGQTTSEGGTGLTTAEMQDINTYLTTGWDFADETLNGTCDYWQISPGDYPRLHYPVMPEGFGTAEEPYLIRDARDLGTVWFKPTSHYRLETSLDLSGTTWSMAVVPCFDGTFEGNGHVISNLHIQGSRYLGLFGQLGPGAKISNLGLEAVDVEGTGDSVGGLAGNNSGSITTSYSTGVVSGDHYVGGLVGFNRDTITNCYSTGIVSGKYYVGGLVGENYEGTITNCSTTGNVQGDELVGGLVGLNRSGVWGDGTITNCYATGSVSGLGRVGGLVGNNWGAVTDSFWDTQTSGQTTSAGGTGKTTAEMQTESTFTDAGWDFVGESVNGTEDIWSICEGTNYPRLVWQIPAGDFVCPDGITIDDFLFFIEHWRDDNCDSNNDYCQGTDLDFSGTVDEADLEILVENWVAGVRSD